MEEIIILNPADLDLFTKSKKFQKVLKEQIDKAKAKARAYRYSQGPHIVEGEK